MKIIFDTNVLIDVVQKREPHFAESYRAVQLAIRGTIDGAIPASSLTDIFYIIRHSVRDNEKARNAVLQLTNLLAVCDTKAEDTMDAFTLPMTDYEDAVVASTAKREKADFILTRNAKDFANSPVPAITPTDFLKQNFTD